MCTSVVPLAAGPPRWWCEGGAAAAAVRPARTAQSVAKLPEKRTCCSRSKVAAVEKQRENTGHCYQCCYNMGKLAPTTPRHQDLQVRGRVTVEGELTQRCYVTVLDGRGDIVREVLYRVMRRWCWMLAVQ